jgi:glycosyltransferase involved in cell wall biosynthesis
MEPSKVGPQHITLLEGYLGALLALDLPRCGLELVYRADPSSHATLSDSVRARVPLEPIAVIDPDQRRWVAKGLQELGAVRAALAKIGPDDVLVITCLTAPALFLLELAQAMIADRRVVVVLHSELEALFDPGLRSPRTWGFWAYRWFRARRPSSRLGIAVIAPFVRDALETSFPETFPPGSIRLLSFPVSGGTYAEPEADGPPRVVFIGYKTRFKGFDVFASAAAALADEPLAFECIGGGKVESVPGGRLRGFSAGGFLDEVARSSLAVFPYQQGYVVTMSAAALDAVATGVHVVATRRPCFEALAAEFGPDCVTLFDTEAELQAILRDRSFIARVQAGAVGRRGLLARSSFGPAATRSAFATLLEDFGFPRSDKVEQAA